MPMIADIAQLVFNVAVIWWAFAQMRLNRYTRIRIELLERWGRPRKLDPLGGLRGNERGETNLFAPALSALCMFLVVSIVFPHQDPPPTDPGEPEPGLEPQAIEEVRIYPPTPASFLRQGPPPRIDVVQVPHPDRTSKLLRIRFTTGGFAGKPERDAWIILSRGLQMPGINRGTDAEPVLELVRTDLPDVVILPFPAGQAREWLGMFTRDVDSGEIWLQGSVELTAPLFLQLVVKAPEENATGFVTSYAHGLIPGGGAP